MKSIKLLYLSIFGFIIVSFVICSNNAAYADHSLGNACYACHNLKSSKVFVSSKSILNTLTILTTLPNNFVEGDPFSPFDCSFCHKSASDIPTLFKGGVTPNMESSHPVDVIGDEDDLQASGGNEIVCADCHMLETAGVGQGYDVVTADLQVDDNTDGYPWHKFIIDGFTPYGLTAGGTSYPNDAINKAHLTAPYGTKVAADPNRTVNWGGVLDETTLLCFICHSSTNLAAGVTQTGVFASNSYSIEAEYNKVSAQGITAGHVILTAGGSLNVGDKLPCYDCHDSHAASGIDSNKKLIRNTANPYGSSTLNITGFDDLTSDLVVCAACHDTGNTSTSTGSIVEGLAPVDPFNSTLHSAIHIGNGVAAAMTSSTTSCLSVLGGCHANAHNPKGSPTSDNAPCWSCHSNLKNGNCNLANDSCDKGNNACCDFGGIGNTRTQTTDINVTSIHNITFSSSSTGEDGSIPGSLRGACTVCHTIEKQADGESNHDDGIVGNSFRDVSPGGFNELNAAPVTTGPDAGTYRPAWFLCIDCHDDRTKSISAAYYNVIGDELAGNVSAPLELDQFLNVDGDEFIYGSGDFPNPSLRNYDNQPLPDAIGAAGGGDGLNATPVKRYDLQPFKAHSLHTNTNSSLYVTPITDSDPESLLYDAVADKKSFCPSDLSNNRVMGCLDCHCAHGSPNKYLFRSTRSPVQTSLTHSDGREMCLDCHNATPQPEVFPLTTTRDMWEPPATDRYLNNVPEHTDPTVGCSNYNAADHTLFQCHNTHAPTCEACHMFYPTIP